MEIHIQWRLRKGMFWVQNLSSTQSWMVLIFKICSKLPEPEIYNMALLLWTAARFMRRCTHGSTFFNCSKQHDEIQKMALLFSSFMCFMRFPATGWKPMEWNAKEEDPMTSCDRGSTRWFLHPWEGYVQFVSNLNVHDKLVKSFADKFLIPESHLKISFVLTQSLLTTLMIGKALEALNYTNHLQRKQKLKWALCYFVGADVE
jgi:hypothetical protein